LALMAFRYKKRRRLNRSFQRQNLKKGLTLLEIAIVIFVISILLYITGSMVKSISIFKDTEDEAELLKRQILYSSQTAILSNEVVYLELDLDEETYRSFRMERSEGGITEEPVVTKHSLSGFHSLISVAVNGGSIVTEKTIQIPFSPDGSAQEAAVYMGPEGEINATLIIRKYGPRVDLFQGEQDLLLDNPDWEEKLEEF